MSIRVSVVVPCRDSTDLLEDCLRSALTQQQVEYVQLIIVDDGSSEANGQTISRVWSRLGTGLLIRSRRPGGAAAARNLGSRVANEPLLFFLDSDTVLEPLCFHKLYQAMEREQTAYAYSGFKMTGGLDSTFPSQPFNPAQLKTDNYISTMSLMRRSRFPGFDEDLTRFQDWALWLHMLKRGDQGAFVPEILFTAHYGPGSISLGGRAGPAHAKVIQRYT